LAIVVIETRFLPAKHKHVDLLGSIRLNTRTAKA